MCLYYIIYTVYILGICSIITVKKKKFLGSPLRSPHYTRTRPCIRHLVVQPVLCHVPSYDNRTTMHQALQPTICTAQVILKHHSCTPGSHPVYAVRTLLGVDQKILPIRREHIWSGFLSCLMLEYRCYEVKIVEHEKAECLEPL